MLPLKITIGTFLRVYGSIGPLRICVRSYSGIYFQINELLRTLITLHILWIQNQHLILFKLRRFLTFDDTRLITLFWNTWLMMLIECYNSRENGKNVCINFPSSFTKKILCRNVFTKLFENSTFFRLVAKLITEIPWNCQPYFVSFYSDEMRQDGHLSVIFHKEIVHSFSKRIFIKDSMSWHKFDHVAIKGFSQKD